MPTTSESRLIAAPRSEVWDAVTDLETAARWNQVWQRVEYLSSQREGVDTTFRAHTEDGLAHDFRICEWDPPQYVAFAPVKEEPQDKGYLITLESQSFFLEPVNDHTSVTLSATAAGHGLRGWLVVRFLWPGYQRQGLARALDALQALFEPREEKDEAEGEGPANA